MRTIEISFDPRYQCGISTPHLSTTSQETFWQIINTIPDGTRFHVGHIDNKRVTGRGEYEAGENYPYVVHERGTCRLDEWIKEARSRVGKGQSA